MASAVNGMPVNSITNDGVERKEADSRRGRGKKEFRTAKTR
jgi:hypothetical protein